MTAKQIKREGVKSTTQVLQKQTNQTTIQATEMIKVQNQLSQKRLQALKTAELKLK